MAKSAADIIGQTCDQVAALPWRQGADGKVRILLITSRTNGKWMLPKGWRMDGKTDFESALIEAREEAGIDGEVSQVPIGSYRYIKLFDDGGSMPAQAVVYPVASHFNATNGMKSTSGLDVGSVRKRRLSSSSSPTSSDF